MKQSLYDIFDHFTPEDNTLPHLKEQPMNEKAISDQVFSKIGYHPIVKTKKKKSYRLFGNFSLRNNHNRRCNWKYGLVFLYSFQF